MEEKKPTPTEKFVKLQEICATCIQDRLDEISIEDAQGNLMVPDMPGFCKRHQGDDTCECLKAFKSFLGKKQKKNFEFCARCCAGHDVEIAPVYMFQEVRSGGDKICPLIPEGDAKVIFDTIAAREEACPMKLIKIMEG